MADEFAGDVFLYVSFSLESERPVVYELTVEYDQCVCQYGKAL